MLIKDKITDLLHFVRMMSLDIGNTDFIPLKPWKKFIKYTIVAICAQILCEVRLSLILALALC